LAEQRAQVLLHVAVEAVLERGAEVVAAVRVVDRDAEVVDRVAGARVEDRAHETRPPRIDDRGRLRVVVGPVVVEVRRCEPAAAMRRADRACFARGRATGRGRTHHGEKLRQIL
jgi:hypothetical protein